MTPERKRYAPPTAEEIAADLAAIGPPNPPPWQNRDPWPPGSGRHDPATCETCAPARTAAYASGEDEGNAWMTRPG